METITLTGVQSCSGYNQLLSCPTGKLSVTPGLPGSMYGL